MGSGASNSIKTSSSPGSKSSHDDENSVRWKVMLTASEAREKFEEDGTISKNCDPAYLELRAMLAENVAQHTLGKLAKEKKCLEDFMCWVDIQEYKSIPKWSLDYRRSKALHIFHKYIKQGAILQIGGLEPNEATTFKEHIDNSRIDKDTLTIDLFDTVQRRCFHQIFQHVFCPFKGTEPYQQLTMQIENKYNRVTVDDFEYMEKLGEGGFGLVVHCKKKSTGKHYAMKIQTKKGMLSCFLGDCKRVTNEKQAYASCQHPFIVNLDYALHTDTVAMMALGLSTNGDLQQAQLKAPNERFTEDRVQFFAAEIVSALGYLHQLGMIYRDLKPSNVLLNSEGHIQLVDLGGVLDCEGRVLGVRCETDGLIPLFARHLSSMTEEATSGTEESTDKTSTSTAAGQRRPVRPKHRMSIMGTFGYMAPEMVIMLSQTSKEKIGYTNAVDWWSLGVTIYKLLTGSRPFSKENFNTFMEMAPSIDGHKGPAAMLEFAILFQQIPFAPFPFISADAIDLITRLLDVNDKTRLGSGPSGLGDIKAHSFFRSINWELLEQKHMLPPYRPDLKPPSEIPLYPSFEVMMSELQRSDWLSEAPNPADQKYFSDWNFASTQTLRIEFGIANEMDQYDRNFKVRRMLGEKAVEKGGPGSTRSPTSKRDLSMLKMKSAMGLLPV